MEPAALAKAADLLASAALASASLASFCTAMVVALINIETLSPLIQGLLAIDLSSS